jgi:PAS domain S-box-containing protein
LISNYAYTPTIWPSFFTFLLLIALAIYSGRRHSVPGALQFSIGCLFAALWAAGSVMEYAAATMETKIQWVKFQASWQTPAATAILCFALEYAWPGRWLTRRNVILLSIPPLVALGLILTNDLHHLLWGGFEYNGAIIPLRGPANWIFVVYGIGLGVVNLIVFIWLFRRSPQHRWPVVFMLSGLIVGHTLYLMEATRMIPPFLTSDFPPFAFEFLMYAIALFAFHILVPIPLAHQAVILQMHDGMLVLDPQGKIVSLNPAAEHILGRSADHLRGQPVEKLLPASPYWLFTGTDETEIELSLPEEISRKDPTTVQDGVVEGPAYRHFNMGISMLKDWRGLNVGHLLLLHDVTEQKRAQAQIVEQQRALATLEERERLARELHDGIGQVLGYAGFQVEAASKLIQDGQVASAVTQLDRLAAVVSEAHDEVRENIQELHAPHNLEQPFFATLHHYLEGFTNNFGIQTQLDADEDLDDEHFPPDAQMQVSRILQEALSNARKHGHACCIQVAFAVEDDLLCMTIQDDGAGFDPSQIAGGNHFGLRFMRERAEGLGGNLLVDSTPGQGTRVTLKMPASLVQIS